MLRSESSSCERAKLRAVVPSSKMEITRRDHSMLVRVLHALSFRGETRIQHDVRVEVCNSVSYNHLFFAHHIRAIRFSLHNNFATNKRSFTALWLRISGVGTEVIGMSHGSLLLEGST